ncbi:hypothetical protein [cf. Phormidesmis sp. LEGE 11477]|uniref:hypothetical protein n=1 Tax=cf. Phormidesmis sp. LEGE 11477 TaxID=1828680 RepID=UPI00188094F1|nr:hypothetical protein [cf. Phormidesmis sp. LEGE 11477]MBE9064098.1 hypothetical protein [cf. Phormidesmis sp. LEGE 11477]
MASLKQLSLSGYYDIEFILSQAGINPNDAHRICYESLKQLGRLPAVIKQQGEDYRSWTSFSDDISPTQWEKFFHKKHPVPSSTYLAFCKMAQWLDTNKEFDIKGSETFDLCTPSKACITFRQCKEQVDRLLDLAKKRLLIESESPEEQLKLYKQSLGIKNKEFLIEPEHEHRLRPEHIFSDSMELIEGGAILQIRLRATVAMPEYNSFRDITWGFAMVNVRTGCSELLLDNRPFVWEGQEVRVSNKTIRRVRLPEGIRLTAKAITLLKEACVECPGQQRVSNFGGWLKDTNLTIFKKEYLKCKREGIFNERQSQQQALLKTPFGRARNKIGISQFDIRVMEKDEKGVPKAVLVKSACIPGLEDFAA